MKRLALATFISVFCCTALPGEQVITASDFAIKCQHPGHKSTPMERIRKCSGMISKEVQVVGGSKKTPECWASLDKVSPASISEVIFHDATDPGEKHKSYRSIANEAILIAAPECN